MRKCSIKLKIALVMGAVYAALLTVLLTGTSYAKYTEERMAYANFGAASFNSVILSAENEKSEMIKGNVKAFDIFDETLKLQITDYRPGMKYDGVDRTKDTSKKIGFVIANGVNAENASEAHVQYQIALRTTKHLPLKYSLLDSEGNLYLAGDSLEILPENEEIGTVWYEQRFYKSDDAGSDEEVIFELPGGALRVNEYQLVVEWPADTDESNVRYMKEVELLQLFVTVSSKNKLDEAATEIKPEYGNGVIVLDAEKGSTFLHYVDYRVFEKNDTNTAYLLKVQNGVGAEVKQTTEQTRYKIEIEVPWTTKTSTFVYRLYRADGTEIALQTEGNEYRLYDELYDSDPNSYNYVMDPIETQIAQWGEPRSDERLYKAFIFEGEVLNNGAPGANEYQLVLSGTDSISDETIFEHKIKIRVTAEAVGSQLNPTVNAEGGGTDG